MATIDGRCAECALLLDEEDAGTLDFCPRCDAELGVDPHAAMATEYADFADSCTEAS